MKKIDLFDLYSSFLSLVNTHQGGCVRPVDFINWVIDTGNDIFNNYKEDFEKTQVVSDALMPYLRSVPVLVTEMRGQNYDLITPPKDYHYFTSARLKVAGSLCCADSDEQIYDCSKSDYIDEEDAKVFRQRAQDANVSIHEVSKVKNNRWNAIGQRRTLKPSFTNAFITQFDGGFKLMPKGAGIVEFDYLRLPVTPVFAYKLVDEGTETERFVYDAKGSTQLEWNYSIKPEFLAGLEARYNRFTGYAK